MTTPVLVTAAAGNVGREVVRSLLARGLEPIAAHHDADRARALFDDAVRTVRLDFRAPDSWPDAIGGARHLFLVRPPAIADVKRTLLPFIDCARERGVDHIVFLSVAGAEKNKVVPHRTVEDHLRATGVHHTNLRPGFFAQNLGTAYQPDIVEEDRIYVPAGRRQPVNWIDVRDIADVAALIFANPARHRGVSYTLTGPGPVSWQQVTDTLSSVLGRPIRYEPASVPGYVRHLARRGLPRGAILVQTILHVLLRFGQGATFDPALERLLGRRPRTVHEYIEDHAELWTPPSSSP